MSLVEVRLTCTQSAADECLLPLLNHMRRIGNGGHSFGIRVDQEIADNDREFLFDGDGNHFIKHIDLDDPGMLPTELMIKKLQYEGRAKRVDPGNVDPDQLAAGIQVEYEHTYERGIAEQIALDHLVEIPDYYTRLAQMEEQAKRDGVFVEESEATHTAVAELIQAGVPFSFDGQTVTRG